MLFFLQGWALALPHSFTVFKVQCNWSPEGFLEVGTALGKEGPDPPCLDLWEGFLLGVSRARVEAMGKGQGITLCSLTEGWLRLQMFTLESSFLHSTCLPLYYIFKNRSDSISQVTLLQAAAYVCQFCVLSVK